MVLAPYYIIMVKYMKKIFILGASRLQIPAIKKAKEKGLYVYVLDYDTNATGIKYADQYLEISTIDKEAVYAAAIKYTPDYIITSTSDMPVRTVSWVNEQLNKPTDISYADAICATDKVAMRNRMKNACVPIPKFHVIDTYDKFRKVIPLMPQQFILKPSDSSASRGVILIDKSQKNNFKDLYNYCIEYSKSGIALVEEYMEGPEVSVESYSINGIPHIISITDKIVTEHPFFVELGHTEPSRLSTSIQDDIRNVAESAIKAIGIMNGPTHTEIKITPDGAKLVEIAARLGGDYITSRLVPLSTGVDMIECSFNTLLNETVSIQKNRDKGAAIRFLHGGPGFLKEISGLDKVKMLDGIEEVELYKTEGDYICSPKSSSDRIGHIIATGNDADEASSIVEHALSLIKMIIE